MGKFSLKEFNIKKFGFLNFYIGIFFLSSALPISIFFLLVSITISIYLNRRNFFKDKWNYPFFIVSFLISISCAKNYFFNNGYLESNINRSLIWIDFLNWVTFFLIFWAFQTYLKTKKDRYMFSKVLITSLIPVLFSCILQSWFKVYGPFNLFDGLIVWFQRPLLTWNERVTGLFNNPNYTSIWLSCSWPFVYLATKNNSKFKALFAWLLLILTSYFLIQTGSRNAILTLLISLKFFITFKVILFSILILFITSLLAFNLNLYQTFFFIENSTNNNITYLINRLFNFNLANFGSFLRIELWKNVLFLIFKKPIFGWGASTFAIIYQLEVNNPSWLPQHAHNMPLQLAYNYGLLVSIILSSTILSIFIYANISIFSKKMNSEYDLINKIWLAACFIMIFSQIVDLSYFDGKIGIFIWILIAGSKCIIDENISKNKTLKPKKVRLFSNPNLSNNKN